ncbi:MAG: hypothetical protein GOMPHAMPRED_006575 [Gomphillus americanus]|uniref:Mid2 domain-containing protein n=1 Tax=Gomphillus americanus TaxID=1940652 RepID=A0A8H3FX57_9LECA|nr:MAG: hypothetical protein GOMPHAMPRED_006575 [Gomphillus americanus]
MQHYRLATRLTVILIAIGNALAQSSENLPGFLSIVQSLATVLEPSSTASSSSSSTSKASTSSTPGSTLATAAATTTSSPSSTPTAGNATSGLDPHTRDIIIGVMVPIGLILLAAIVALILCCCARRRKKNRRINREMKYDEAKSMGNDDWVRGNDSHHGLHNNTAGVFGTTNNIRYDPHHGTAPLMGTDHVSEMKSIEDPVYENGVAEKPTSNSFTPAQIVPRKPIPNRFSNGSATTPVSADHHHDSHNGAVMVAGAGVAAGAAAVMHHHDQNRRSSGNLAKVDPMYHHDQNRRSSGSLAKVDALHKPLGSHPQNQPPMYTSSGPDKFQPNWRPSRPATPPFSPDDVGSMHRRSQRFSTGSTMATDHANVPVVAAAIDAPTSSQRHSLQSRHSGFEDGEPPRGPSRSPKRRSLTGGGELWEADSMFRPALSSRRRSSGGDLQYTATEAAPPLPNQGRYSNREISQAPLLNSGSTPYNKHLSTVQGADTHNPAYSSTTDSSTSNESYESAQAYVNSWNYSDPGRYPRFSGGSDNMPLIPPGPVWKEGDQRRWSDGTPKSTNGLGSGQDDRRYSGGNSRTQRARFSNGHPEYYNEAGLVGRAL